MNFEFARKELTKELSQKGIKDPRVLEAVYQIPRHEFVDATFTSRAYQDMSLPIGHQQTISQPFVVAKIAISKNKIIYSKRTKRITNMLTDKLTHYLRFKNDAIMIP